MPLARLWTVQTVQTVQTVFSTVWDVYRRRPIFVPMIEVWYDGACPLCVREIALMRRLDRAGRIRFHDLSGAEAVCPLDRRLLLERLHAREDGRLLSGAAAFAAMWRAIPLLRPLGLLARRPAVLRLLERLYAAFLRVRPKLQRLAARL